MSQTALPDFAKIAQQLAEALDQHKPTQGNQTLLVLTDLANELPDDNPLRLSVEEQIVKLISTDFSLSEPDLNKTLIVLGSLKGRLKPEDAAQDKIDVLMAKVLSTKFDLVNRGGSSSSSSASSSANTSPISIPGESTSETEPTEEVKPSISIPEPAKDEAPAAEETSSDPALTAAISSAALGGSTEITPESTPVEPDIAPTPEPSPAPQPDADQFAGTIHSLQLALDQMPVATRQAFPELKAVEDNGGTVQAFIDSVKSKAANPEAAQSQTKTELERLSAMIAKIEEAPAEADQFQVLYDQVDPKHKDLKTGVFSIFQREYGGNARRFVVERTAQYAKYVPADESRQRMIEDLHKLIEQAQKTLGQTDKAKAAPAGDKTTNRAFFHG